METWQSDLRRSRRSRDARWRSCSAPAGSTGKATVEHGEQRRARDDRGRVDRADALPLPGRPRQEDRLHRRLRDAVAAGARREVGQAGRGGRDQGREARHDHAAGRDVQVTYNGFPLYRFAGDTKSGQVNGQGLESSWYVLAPSGAVVKLSTAPAAGGRHPEPARAARRRAAPRAPARARAALRRRLLRLLRLRARLLDRVADAVPGVLDRIGATLGEDPAERAEEPRPRDLLALERVSGSDRLNRRRVRDVPLSRLERRGSGCGRVIRLAPVVRHLGIAGRADRGRRVRDRSARPGA